MSIERLKKIANMGAHQIYTRCRQEASKRSHVLYHRLGWDPFRPGGNLEFTGAFYRDRADIPGILDVFRKRLPDDAAHTIARADRLLNGRFDLLGYRDLDFGRDLQWSLDPVHGKTAPPQPWPVIPYLDFLAVGDHKIVWELNRHQFLPTLAKAYRLTGDARYAARLIELWNDWRAKNPYPLGINWASALEVAFRVLSWMWTAFLLAGTPADSAAFQRDLAVEVGRCGWYLERFLSTYFSPNTHLLGEGFALFVIGCAYPGLRGAAAWKREGWRIVLEESRRQVRADGLHFEQSIYYHVYAVDFFLHARILAGRNGIAVPPEFDATLRRMLTATAELSQAGALPRFGDDDGGRLFDGTRNRAAEMLDPLVTGAVLFRDSGLKPRTAALCEETLWLLGAESAAAFDALPPPAPKLAPVAMPDAGIYAMSANSPAPAQLFVDAGILGGLVGGHGHADLLSIQLAAAGRLLLTDPGTGAYMGNDGVRERFRGTAAHNTLTIDGHDQAAGRGPFAWQSFPPVSVHRWEPGEHASFLDASHGGYHPLTHRRIVTGLDRGIWLVRDIVEGSGDHTLDIYWHFAPLLSVEPRGRGIRAVGDAVPPLVIVPLDDAAWELHLERGEYSPAYGGREPAWVARFSARVPCPAEFAVVLSLAETPDTACLERTASGYVYTAGSERFVFPLNGPPV